MFAKVAIIDDQNCKHLYKKRKGIYTINNNNQDLNSKNRRGRGDVGTRFRIDAGKDSKFHGPVWGPHVGSGPTDSDLALARKRFSDEKS